MVKYNSLKELLIRLKDKSDRAQSLRASLSTYLTPGKRQALSQSLKLLEGQVKDLITQFNRYGEGDILEVTFEVHSPTQNQRYRRKFINITTEEAEELVKYRYSGDNLKVDILEIKVLPTSNSWEKL